MYSTSIEPKVQVMFGELNKKVETIVSESSTSKEAIEKVTKLISSELATRSKSILSDMLFELTDKLMETEYFSDISKQNKFTEINLRQHNILIPLLLTLGAGLATGIGSAIAFFAKRTNKRLLSFSLGLSGGVMIYVSFVELFQQANTTLSAEWGAHTGVIVTVASFFAGILLIGVIDRLVPSIENPHEAHRVEEMDHQPHNPRLMRMGVMTALAIGIHNFPEGIATFTSAVDNMALGVAIAVAIAIHNIPEGIAVSIPIYYATGDRRKAFRLSLLSGLAEPVGAILAWLVLTPFMTPTLMGCILAGVAGIMVFISIDELLPAAREYGEAHISIYGVVAGMALMAVSLILLA